MFFNGGVKNKKAPAPVQEAAVSRNAVKLPNYCALLALQALCCIPLQLWRYTQCKQQSRARCSCSSRLQRAELRQH